MGRDPMKDFTQGSTLEHFTTLLIKREVETRSSLKENHRHMEPSLNSQRVNSIQRKQRGPKVPFAKGFISSLLARVLKVLGGPIVEGLRESPTKECTSLHNSSPT